MRLGRESDNAIRILDPNVEAEQNVLRFQGRHIVIQAQYAICCYMLYRQSESVVERIHRRGEQL
jgi:hypothetical protein